MKKLRVGVIYGGRSGEHEVSLASAASVFLNLDPARYDAVAIRIEKDGRWTLPPEPPTVMKAADVIKGAVPAATAAARETHPMAFPGGDTLLTIDPSTHGGHDDARSGQVTRVQAAVSGVKLDVVFPVLHGPYGEDGTVQGLLELANVPYVGAGVLASAVGMDKAAMKLVFAAKGLPICDYEVVLKRDWQRDEHAVLQQIVARLGFPVFVKPANLGSSVGISKAKHAAELRTAIALAAQFDRKIVIEAAVPKAREIEVAVLGNDDPGRVGARRDHPVGRVLRLRGQVRQRRLAHGDPGGHRRGARRRGARARDRGVQGDRRRRHGARRLSPRR